MSTSTVPITAAIPATRRRPVIGSDNRTASNLELLANDIAGTGDEDTTSTTGIGRRSLSHHTIRGEAILERSSMDITRATNRVAGRNSTGLRKSRKPLTFSRIFKNNVVRVVLIAELFLLILRVAFNSSGEGVDGGFTGLSEFEGRISDAEDFLKKIEDEVLGLRKEMSEKIDENNAFLDNELKKLETYLSELKLEDWITKQEFEKFVDEFRIVKGNEYNGDGLDEIREFAKGVIEKEIEKHAADGLGKVDYALGSAGASITRHSEPYDVERSNWFLLSVIGVHPNADKMLKPSFGEPGQCFPMEGSTGFVQIRLHSKIIPEAVTLEHVAKSVAYRSSAPKECRIYGWLYNVVESVIFEEKMFLLAEFTYDLEKSNAQTFNVLNSASDIVVDTIRLDFDSNHGSDSYTCLYRLRVHGHEPESVL